MIIAIVGEAGESIPREVVNYDVAIHLLDPERDFVTGSRKSGMCVTLWRERKRLAGASTIDQHDRALRSENSTPDISASARARASKRPQASDGFPHSFDN